MRDLDDSAAVEVKDAVDEVLDFLLFFWEGLVFYDFVFEVPAGRGDRPDEVAAVGEGEVDTG